ncbi:MAG TPA: BACON domain-containing carbohydrate-binding protein [Vicinamibacterales bacterium]|nr:BACON domain-containing carbohydrate-binding protein [Vicinamibacterales bacterium]
MFDGLDLTSPGPAIGRLARRVQLVAVLLALTATSCTTNSATITAPSPVKCAPSLVLASSTMAASGGTGVLSIATTAECAWTASAQVTWLSGFSPASGQGSAQVAFQVAANSIPAAREGDVVVNDERARIRQEAAPCQIELAPTARDVSASGESVSATVTAPSECAWAATTDVSWITVTSSSTGNGNGTLSIAVAANSGGQRTGTVQVADQALTIRQAAATCSYTLTPSALSIAAAGGAGGPVTVSTSAGCAWTAVSNASWITVTAGQSGSGSGTVSFTVAANSGDSRTGTLSIAGQTFTVTQAGIVSCSYSVTPTSQTIGPSGGVAPAIAVATAAACAWTANSNAPWITLLSGTSGTGNGAVTYEVAANTGNARTATLTIAGHAVTVSQSAAGSASARYNSVASQAVMALPLKNGRHRCEHSRASCLVATLAYVLR